MQRSGRPQTKAWSVDNALPHFLLDFFALRVDKVYLKIPLGSNNFNDTEEVLLQYCCAPKNGAAKNGKAKISPIFKNGLGWIFLQIRTDTVMYTIMYTQTYNSIISVNEGFKQGRRTWYDHYDHGRTAFRPRWSTQVIQKTLKKQ